MISLSVEALKSTIHLDGGPRSGNGVLSETTVVEAVVPVVSEFPNTTDVSSGDSTACSFVSTVQVEAAELADAKKSRGG